MPNRTNPGRLARFVLPFLALGIAIGTNGASAQTTVSTPLMVMDIGRQFSKGTFPRQARWQRLVCERAECRIESARVKVSTSKARNSVEEDEALDVLNVDRGAVAFFPGGQFHLGKAETWYVRSERDSPQRSSLKKLGRWSIPGGPNGDRSLVLSWVRTPEDVKRYHIASGTARQFLFQTDLEGKYGEDKTPAIIWVGDLDRDGNPDFLLDIPDDNCGYDERLYLSSQAGEGKIVRKAAQLVGGEAACGC